MKALLSQYRQSPRKVRLLAKAIVGKSVPEALTILSFTVKRSAAPIKKLLTSAVANAKQKGISAESLLIKKLEVNPGPVYKRIMPRARGSAARILKRTSHVFIELAPSIKMPVQSPKSKVKSKSEDKRL